MVRTIVRDSDVPIGGAKKPYLCSRNLKRISTAFFLFNPEI